MNINVNNTQEKETIILRIIDEVQNKQVYECNPEDLLEKYINLFISNL